MPASNFLRHHWPRVTIAVTAAAIAFAAVVMFSTMPPRRIVMATGPEGGTYYEIGQRYRAALARENVDVQLVSTQGSIENLALLHDPHSGVSVAFIQGGSVGAGQKSGLESLGTLFYEPMWWFHRRDIQGEGVPSLVGRKISIGPEGSGTRALALELIKAAGIERRVELLPLTPRESADRLLAGEIDVAFMMTSWESPVVRQLLADEHVESSTGIGGRGGSPFGAGGAGQSRSGIRLRAENRSVFRSAGGVAVSSDGLAVGGVSRILGEGDPRSALGAGRGWTGCSGTSAACGGAWTASRGGTSTGRGPTSGWCGDTLA